MRVLFVAHGHPDLYIGGAEIFAYELFRGLRDRAGIEATFLARTFASGHERPSRSPFRAHAGRGDEILWFPGEYDNFYQTLRDKSEYGVAFRELLNELRPDVVHVQHTSGLGYGILREVRRTLPRAALLYTLHEFLPICQATGLMRTTDGNLCERATPVRCHNCFPEIPAARFKVRELAIRDELAHVDRFIVPSHCLRERYTAWGLPAERIVYEEYGRLPLAIPETAVEPPIDHVAFLGQLAPHKGLETLLEAARSLAASGEGASGEGASGGGDFRLFVHGANLDRQPADFRRRFDDLVAACGEHVVVAGAYSTTEVPALLENVSWVVVPSLWWENSPLVIQEAFASRRPVICSDIGGMAEKVRDEVDGLHFRVGDPESLARTLQRAVGSRELWRELQQQIRPVHSMDDTVAFHLELYRSLLDERSRAFG